MGLRFKLKNPQKALKAIEEFKIRVDKAIVNRLIYVGESFVKDARENGNYLDQTGNLRSSIGYIVLKNGKSVNENFKQADKGTDKASGLKAAKKLIKELKSEFTSGYTLIVVAGMEYAAAVESKGKDVLTGSSYEEIKALKSAVEKINEKSK